MTLKTIFVLLVTFAHKNQFMEEDKWNHHTLLYFETMNKLISQHRYLVKLQQTPAPVQNDSFVVFLTLGNWLILKLRFCMRRSKVWISKFSLKSIKRCTLAHKYIINKHEKYKLYRYKYILPRTICAVHVMFYSTIYITRLRLILFSFEVGVAF